MVKLQCCFLNALSTEIYVYECEYEFTVPDVLFFSLISQNFKQRFDSLSLRTQEAPLLLSLDVLCYTTAKYLS